MTFWEMYIFICFGEKIDTTLLFVGKYKATTSSW